jgi:hypothetical protein
MASRTSQTELEPARLWTAYLLLISKAIDRIRPQHARHNPRQHSSRATGVAEHKPAPTATPVDTNDNCLHYMPVQLCVQLLQRLSRQRPSAHTRPQPTTAQAASTLQMSNFHNHYSTSCQRMPCATAVLQGSLPLQAQVRGRCPPRPKHQPTPWCTLPPRHSMRIALASKQCLAQGQAQLDHAL